MTKNWPTVFQPTPAKMRFGRMKDPVEATSTGSGLLRRPGCCLLVSATGRPQAHLVATSDAVAAIR